MFEFNIKNYGFAELFACILLNACGLVFIQSSVGEQIGSFMSQLGISIASLFLCLLISFLNLKRLISRYYIFMIVSVFLLVLVRITGTAFGRNAIRWIEIPVINMQIQPSEFAKLFLILFMAKYMEKMDTQINIISNFFKVLGYFSLPFILIFIQPNLSSSLILFFIFFCMLFASKLKLKFFAVGIGIILSLFLVVFISVKQGFIYNLPFLRDYQKNRIVSFFEPTTEKNEGTYQQENSVIAIGSGKIIGKGINNKSPQSVKNGNWLAEAQNDFIFAVVGEEVGFLGSVIIILIYVYLIISCISIASKQREYYKNLICIGVASWIGIQTFINIAVATSIMPNTGVPLPFFSQGGSSLMSIYMAMGFVLNIKREVRI